MSPARFAQAAFLLVMILQFVWHALLPEPHGNENWILASIAAAPLLLLLPGILGGLMRSKNQQRSMIWGAYLLVLYFILGIMEAWSNPPQRAVALLQVALTVLYFTSLLFLARKGAPEHD